MLRVWVTIVSDLYHDWSKSILVHLMEINYALLQVSLGMYEEARKQRWHGGRGEWDKKYMVLQNNFSSLKGETLATLKKEMVTSASLRICRSYEL